MMNDNDSDDMLPVSGGNDEGELARRLAMGSGQGPNDEFVDRFEGDTAILVKNGPNGHEIREVHRSELPPGTQEGDVIPASKESLYSARPGESDQDYESLINSIYTPFPR